MENISRIFNSKIKNFNIPKRGLSPKDKKTLLLIDDCGTVVSVNWIKSLVVILVLVLITTTALTVCFFYLYNKAGKEKIFLQNDLKKSQNDVLSLQGEKELLMAQLGSMQYENKQLIPGLATTKHVASSEENKIKIPIETNKKIKKLQAIGKNSSNTTNSKNRQKLSMKIENFVVSYKSNINLLLVKFKLTKLKPSPNPVSGHIFVILKRNKDDANTWIAIPPGTITKKKPSQIEKGTLFSIVNYKTIKFKASNIKTPGTFKSATVFIYSSDKKKTLEQDFTIKNINLK